MRISLSTFRFTPLGLAFCFFPFVIQYDSAEWEPGKWEPSWNLPQIPSEKWELTYLGPGGLARVFCLS